MNQFNRRGFLSGSTWVLGAALTPALQAVLARAQTIPASQRSGSLMDVEHIVILMQENRSFDHYFGTMSGVRGFGDPHPAPLGADGTVWHQPNLEGRYTTPFRFDVENTSFPVMKSLPHDYGSGHFAWNDGRYDQWLKAKGALTMGYLRREDIPFHHAMADAFTLCDSYFSSIHGPTCPNRLFMLTGSNDPSGLGGGPVTANNNITQLPDGVDVYGPHWVTYAERLQSAGINWRAYRQGTDPRSDDDSDGGMNLLLAFETFINSKPGEPLYERGVLPRRLDQLKADVIANELPQVSWVFPPRLFCEHPKWPPAYGANYVARILDALTSNPSVWSKTVFLVMYDENDGFFDHIVPPSAPGTRAEGLSTVDIAGEINPQDGTPYGLGPRVPMLVISPWSRGGFVCSEVFDHTSILRFIEARFGVRAEGITPWRRTVCGDLTSAFDFKTPNLALPPDLERIDANRPLMSNAEFQNYRSVALAKPKPKPNIELSLPAIESGRRRVRALAYEFDVEEDISRQGVILSFVNTGQLGSHFHVYNLLTPGTPPRRYTVGASDRLRENWPFQNGAYALLVHGPNGFVRELRGAATSPIRAILMPDAPPDALSLRVRNQGISDYMLSSENIYSKFSTQLRLKPKGATRIAIDLLANSGWYMWEIFGERFYRKYAGRRENGMSAWSDPAIA